MQEFVARLAQKYGLALQTNTPEPGLRLTSEQELRDYRWSEIRKLIGKELSTPGRAAHKTGAGILVATAHHLDDRIETQLIRLLRGTGLRGLDVLRFRAVESGFEKIRPLRNFARHEIEAYAKACGLKWKEDPSNRSLDPLRNWLRHKWLAPLERREPGLKRSLARSFETIVDEGLHAAGPSQGGGFGLDVIEKDKIRLQEFLTLSRAEKESVLADYMFSQGFKNYSKSHVQELLKRLDTGRRELNFKMLRREWFINAEHIFCEPS